MPLDEALGIRRHQHSSDELVRLGCLLSVFLPYQTAAWLLGQWSGVQVSADSLWHWVQHYGQSLQTELTQQLAAQAAGQQLAPEPLAPSLAVLPLAIAADGVMVPLRSQPKSPKGKVVWREVKVAILARLEKTLNPKGKARLKLRQRRLVATLGNLEQFIPQVQLEAARQSLNAAPQVVWLSDGGRGFWRVYQECFACCAVAVLDFYHAAAHLWRVAAVVFETTDEQHSWFQRWRHALRHGQERAVLRMLSTYVYAGGFSGNALDTLKQVKAYFYRHQAHIRYQTLAKQDLPMGSGMVESACKWLIQQRFKGTGMRWSEDGFNHLLLLRLAWVNQRFDDLFPLVPKHFPKHPSHNT